MQRLAADAPLRELRAPILVLLLAYGGWLASALTGLFWSGSTLARLVGVVLVFAAPVALARQGWVCYRQRSRSRVHVVVALLSWFYLPALGAVLWWVATRRATPH